MSKQFNVVTIIGRFQPVHNAHVELLKRAGELADTVVIILGSASLPRTFKNPWDNHERTVMLTAAISSLSELTKARYTIEPVVDTMYNDAEWLVRVTSAVQKYTEDTDKIGIIGHNKDESTFYLDMFPQWETITQPLIEPLNATQIREVYFSPSICNLNWFSGVLPPSTIEFLRRFQGTNEYNQIVREREFIESYKLQFRHLKYEPTFVTADAVVFQSGHVLMVKRAAEPGKGLWAFPGGFVNAKTDRSIEDAMVRELFEETGIKVPEKVIRGSIERSQVFDAPERSSRGRTFTHAYKISLDSKGKLPKVRGADDAEKAAWRLVAEVKSDECFEDHYEILQLFRGK